MPHKNAETPHKRPVRYLNESAELPTFYANNVDISISPWDVRLRLGQIELGTESELVIKNIGLVFMSLEHARVFVKKMAESLDSFDRMNTTQP